MAGAPAISVVIPAYNAARTVGVAVDSVLAQTFEDFELLVIDDGSADDTAAVVEARDDPRVRCIRTENGGVSIARNRGVERASGEYVAFLDADDAWDAVKLERQHEALSGTPDSGLCFAGAQIVDDLLEPIGRQPALQRADYTATLLIEGNIISGSASSVMVRRSLIETAGGFDARLSLCADWDMWLRISAITRFVPLDEALVSYRSVPGTMSSDPAVLERDTLAMLDKFYASAAASRYATLRRRAYGRQYMVCAGSYLHTGHVADCVRCAFAGLRSDPRTIGRIVFLPARWIARAGRRAVGRPLRNAKEIS